MQAGDPNVVAVGPVLMLDPNTNKVAETPVAPEVRPGAALVVAAEDPVDVTAAVLKAAVSEEVRPDLDVIVSTWHRTREQLKAADEHPELSPEGKRRAQALAIQQAVTEIENAEAETEAAEITTDGRERGAFQRLVESVPDGGDPNEMAANRMFARYAFAKLPAEEVGRRFVTITSKDPGSWTRADVELVTAVEDSERLGASICDPAMLAVGRASLLKRADTWDEITNGRDRVEARRRVSTAVRGAVTKAAKDRGLERLVESPEAGPEVKVSATRSQGGVVTLSQPWRNDGAGWKW